MQLSLGERMDALPPGPPEEAVPPPPLQLPPAKSNVAQQHAACFSAPALHGISATTKSAAASPGGRLQPHCHLARACIGGDHWAE